MNPLDRLLDFVSRRPRIAFVLSMVALLALAWRNRFIQDDAFILLQYARRLVEGHGLTWLPGERVEGYTTFLWTLLLAVPLALHVDPVAFASGAGLLLFVATSWATFSLASRWTRSPGIALLAVWILGTNHTFSAYATGGLETQLQALLVITSWGLAASTLGESGLSSGRLALFSVVVAASLLTRLDSALLVAAPSIRLAFEVLRREANFRDKLRWGAALTLPALAIVGAWFAWKVPYYGEWLPNTFFAKATGVTSYRHGMGYVLLFIVAYALWPFVLGMAIAWGILANRIPGWIGIALSLALWILYVIRVGGDFMEFRLFVAILPFLAIAMASLIAAVRPRAAAAALFVALPLVSLYHGATYQVEHDIESTALLHSWVSDPRQGWILAGQKLGEAFGEARDSVLVASTAAGAISFYSRIPTLDMHGLMDRWIARHGVLRATNKPGHIRFATLDYLLKRRVNLVIGHPHIVLMTDSVPSWSVAQYVAVDGRKDEIPANARLVELPFGTGYAMTMLELVRNERLDRMIERKGLRTASVAAAP